jgi:hypothetical protein
MIRVHFEVSCDQCFETSELCPTSEEAVRIARIRGWWVSDKRRKTQKAARCPKHLSELTPQNIRQWRKEHGKPKV